MRNTLQLGLRLLVFSLVAGLLLAGTYLITKGPIEEQALIASQSAQRAVLTDAEIFEELNLDEDVPGAAENYPLVTNVYKGMAGDETVGYVLAASPVGYGGPIPITLGVGMDGSIRGIAVGALQETSGIGTKVEEAPFLDQFDALPADPSVIEADVDTISGATVSSGPFKQAVVEMTGLTRDALGIAPNPGTPKPRELFGDDLLRQAQLPAANQFTPLVPFAFIGEGEFDAIQTVYRANAGREVAGYTFELAPMGYADLIYLRASVDAQGNVTAVDIVSQAETQEFGARIATPEGEPFLQQFVGQPAATIADGVDVFSGATVSSNAIIKAVGQAGQFYAQHLIPKPDPDEGITFEDITLPTPDDYKAVQSAQQGMKDGALAKYRFMVQVTGYSPDTPILVQIDVDAAGNFEALVPIQQAETEGIGANVFANADFLSQFLTKPAVIETADAIQAVSGATVTSDALMRGIKQAARAYQSIAAAGGAQALTFEDVTLPTPDDYKAVQSAQRGMLDGAVAKYRFMVQVTGYNTDTPILVQIDVDAAGNFEALVPVQHGETPGLGEAVFANADFLGQFLTKPAMIETADGIQAVSGATVTSDALMRGVKQAARAYQSIAGEGAGKAQAVSAAPAETYPTVEGAFVGAVFEPVSFTDAENQFATVQTIEKATQQDGTLLGYRIVTASTGYNADAKIVLQFEVDAAGNFADVQVLSQAETDGIGAKWLADATYIGKPVGQAADPANTGLLDTISGATVTTDSVIRAAKHASAAYQAVKEVP